MTLTRAGVVLVAPTRSQAGVGAQTLATCTPKLVIMMFQMPRVLSASGKHPIKASKLVVMQAMSVEEKKRIDRFQRLQPPHFDGRYLEDAHDFLDRLHQMLYNLGLVIGYTSRHFH